MASVIYYLNSLLLQADVSLKGTLITASGNTYAYRAYLESALNYSEDAKRSHLTTTPFYLDATNFLDNTKGDPKIGLNIRRQVISQSQEMDMIRRLHSNIYSLSIGTYLILLT